MKKILAMILVLSMTITTFVVPVSADTSLDLDVLQKNLETIITNKAENAKAMLGIAKELVTYAVGKYKDVKDTDWYAEAIGKLSIMDIVNGLTDGRFNPQGEVTRAQFVKMLVQAMEYKKVDSVSFIDMRANSNVKPHWAAVYVETALRNGVIIKAEEWDRFYPDVPITRDDMVMMMCRALKLEPSNGANPYFDLNEANGYFTKAYEEYLVRGIPVGDKVIFNATGVTTRAQAAVIISRMVDYKADPEGFVAKMAMEERIANGTATEADKAAIRQAEIEKAQADPNYIMEPEIRLVNTFEDFAGWGEDAEYKFNLYAGHIAIDNCNDYAKYSPDIQFKVVAIDKNKDLLNTMTVLTQPFISYDHRHEVRIDTWKSLKAVTSYSEEHGTYNIYSIKRNEEKSVNGKYVKVDNYNKKGETINLKLYLKRGTNTEVYDIKFKVN